MKISQKLKSLIYKYNNTIITTSTNIEDLTKEIEAVKSSSKLQGYIFRPGFADTIEFKEYSNEDWYAIFAQWSITWGWGEIFEVITQDNPGDVLNGYLGSISKEKLSSIKVDDNAPSIKRIDYMEGFVKGLVEQNSTLNSQQVEILKSIPSIFLEKPYLDGNITIMETRAIVVSKLLKENKEFNPFKKISEIPMILAETYSLKGSFNGDFTDRKGLKGVKLRIPKSIKKKVIDKLVEDEINENTLSSFKKLDFFWKNILRNILIKNSHDKTISKYPYFAEIHSIVHSNIHTINSDIEYFRKQGLLAEAFELEMKNPGKLLRNISFYLRQPIGSTYPTKTGKEKNNLNTKKVVVTTDIENALQNGSFGAVITGSNAKLLSQAKTILRNPLLKVGDITQKKMNNKLVEYNEPLLRVQEEWLDSAVATIDLEYRRNRIEKNKNIGKVFISEHMKNIPVLHSGKIDDGKTTSGKYLPVGSKTKLDLGSDKIIRYGVSWRARQDNPISICVDPSITIMDGGLHGRVVNFQNPTLENAVNSSGDITMSNSNTWSTELIDIDVNALLEKGSTKFYTAIINYDHPRGNLCDVQCHVFFNVIDRKDRLINGRSIEIPLDKMQHSYEVTENIPAQIGLLFDLTSGECEVLKIPVENIKPCQDANRLRGEFDSLVSCKNEPAFVYDEILLCLDNNQVVDNKEDADLVIDATTENSIIQSILF